MGLPTSEEETKLAALEKYIYYDVTNPSTMTLLYAPLLWRHCPFYYDSTIPLYYDAYYDVTNWLR